MQPPETASAYTPYPEVNAMLDRLIAGARGVLGDRLVGMYLDGSLAYGGFDEASDIDFVAVLDGELLEGDFDALQAMHAALAQCASPWAVELEGSYLPRSVVRSAGPHARGLYPNIERGSGERLKLIEHDLDFNIHRYILREKGLTLFGPAPRTLVDPITPAALRATMRPMLAWLRRQLDAPAFLDQRGYQSYFVLTICRIHYTLATGSVTGKAEAARWASERLDPHWRGLIARAWEDRRHAGGAPDPDAVAGTLAFIRQTLEQFDDGLDAPFPGGTPGDSAPARDAR